MLFGLSWTAFFAIASRQAKGSSDESGRAERRAGGGEGGSATELSTKAQKRGVAELLEEEAITTDIAEEAEKAAVAMAASCAVPAALRVVADAPAVTPAAATGPVFPPWPATAAEGAADPGAAVTATDDEDSGDVIVDAGGEY